MSLALRVAMVLGLWFVSSAAIAQDFARMVSDPLDCVGGGNTYELPEPGGSFTIVPLYGNAFYVAYSAPELNSFWVFAFEAPNNQRLQPVTYPNAVRWPFNNGSPGMEVSHSFFGCGCNEITGSFQVLDVRYDDQGLPSALWLTFEQHCEGAPPALRGELRVGFTHTIPALGTTAMVMLIVLIGGLGLFFARR